MEYGSTQYLTHWGRVTHICVAYLTIIASVNGLSPCRRQAMIWTNAEILLIRPLGTNVSEMLTHWGRVTHICVSELTIIGSDNGLSSDRRQAIIWTNAGILIIGPLGTNFSEILIEILTLSLKKMLLKVSSGKWRPFCFGLNVLIEIHTFSFKKMHLKMSSANRRPFCLGLNVLNCHKSYFMGVNILYSYISYIWYIWLCRAEAPVEHQPNAVLWVNPVSRGKDRSDPS